MGRIGRSLRQPLWLARGAPDLDPAILRDSTNKWCFLAAIGSLDAAWIALSDFRLAAGSVAGPASAAVLLFFGARFFRFIRPNPALFVLVETIAQVFVGFALAGVLSYLALSTDHALVDRYLSAADRALGFDWPRFIVWVQGHPLLDRLLFLAYRGSVPQLLVVAFLLSWSEDGREDGRLRELSGTILISLVLAIAISAALPAISAYPYYAASQRGIVAEIGVPDLFALRDGSLRLLDLRTMDGLVCFPSFHVVLSLLFVHALRGRRYLFALAIVVNAVIIVSTLTAGGHYLVDLFGGALVAALSVVLYRAVSAPRAASTAPDERQAESPALPA